MIGPRSARRIARVWLVSEMMDPLVSARRTRLRWVVVSVGAVAVGFGGYFGFVAFIETGTVAGLGAGIMGLAVATGFAAFFSPCSFPLLLTFLVRHRESRSWRGILRSSLTVGLGAVAFFVLLAAVLAAVGEGVGGSIGFDTTTGRVSRASLGALLVLLGLRQANVIKVRFRAFDAVAMGAARVLDSSKAARPASKDFIYGFGYVLAGFG